MNRCTVIVEPGTTWQRDLGRAFGLIDAAAEAGADGIKFQYCSDPERLARRRNAGDYLTSYYDLKFNPAYHQQLADRCKMRGIMYACTVYIPEDVPVVTPFTSYFKVASFEAGADDLLAAYIDAMRDNDKKLIVSLGLGVDTADVIRQLYHTGDPNDPDPFLNERIVFLHCVSAYPTPIDELNLACLRTVDGLSDHTASNDPDSLNVGALAVASGATWVERHVCLDDTPANHPDRVVALLPWQLIKYVRRIRVAERARGDVNVEGPAPSEMSMLRYRVQMEEEER